MTRFAENPMSGYFDEQAREFLARVAELQRTAGEIKDQTLKTQFSTLATEYRRKALDALELAKAMAM